MHRRTRTFLLAGLLTLLTSLTSFQLVGAQQSTGAQITPANPNASITFPPPVYVLRGQVEIRGTASQSSMTNYFLEFRALAPDMTVPNANAPWIPATLPNRNPVNDDVLGVWNTLTAEDGLYELRLTMNVAGGSAVTHVVSPLRIENKLPPFITPEAKTQVPRVTPTGINRPTLGATPTAFSGLPTVTALTDANVRQGDSTLYGVVGSLLTGQTAQIVGISNSGSGWYYIQLSTGRRGFISPSVVSVSGDISNLTRILPPATPTPTFTPTPPTTGDLIMNGAATAPNNPRCGEPFEVQLNVANIGSNSTTSTFVVRIQDIDIQTNTVTSSGFFVVPVLMAPGQNFVAPVPITVSTFPARDHRIIATVDADNQVLEENESNNTFTYEYRLRQGSCP